MKVLLINGEYPPVGGGAGNASANLARYLASFGHNVTVVTAYFHGLPKEETRDGVTVCRVPARRLRQDRSGAFEQLVFIVSASLWAIRFAFRSKPDATLAFFGVPSGAVAWLLKILFRVPYLVSLRGGDVPGFRPYDFKWFHKVLGPFLPVIWHGASSVVANSRGLRDLALAFDPRIKIPVIPNGVELEEFAVTERDWSTPRILSVGRVVHQKGLDLALHALARLKDMDWHWDIAGDGPRLSELQSLAQVLGIADRVTFLGWQTRKQVAKLNLQSNLFLFPSRHEGMPNAVLEAMAGGLPVIATRIAGNEEIVLDGETGLLVESENVEQLSDAVRKLLSDYVLCKKMGYASRERVEQKYTWKKCAVSYQAILQQAANIS